MWHIIKVRCLSKIVNDLLVGNHTVSLRLLTIEVEMFCHQETIESCAIVCLSPFIDDAVLERLAVGHGE